MRRKKTLPSTPHVVSPVTSYFFINYIEPLCTISKFKKALIKSADSECHNVLFPNKWLWILSFWALYNQSE